jgi:amino acid permease
MSMKKQLTFFPSVLSFISTIIGGGLVGMPYAYYWAGIPLGLVLTIIVAILTVYTTYIYLIVKDMCGR